MNELRFDLTTRDWVVVAAERAQRPHEQSGSDVCPFCPGHEHLTPPEVDRVPDPDGGWALRVVPNRFALLSPDPSPPSGGNEWFAAAAGVGAHEVVIESPDHAFDLTTASVSEVARVLTAYRARCRALAALGAAMTVVFRNRGTPAGTSLAHPHSQILTAPFVPAGLGRTLDIARQHLDQSGQSLHDDLIRRELADGRRVIAKTPWCVAFVPFAATNPYEIWLFPSTKQSSIAEEEPDRLAQMAVVVRDTLAALRVATGDAPYNLVVLNCPTGHTDLGYRWHLRVIPRLTIPGGLELGTGMAVNASSPEACAQRLREASAATLTGSG